MEWQFTSTTSKCCRLCLRVPTSKKYRERLIVVPVDEVSKVFKVERSTIRRLGGLAGSKINIGGLEQVSTDVLVRIERLDGTSETARLNWQEQSDQQDSTGTNPVNFTWWQFAGSGSTTFSFTLDESSQ
jgi:plasmid maintenance system antidote protein VapI